MKQKSETKGKTLSSYVSNCGRKFSGKAVYKIPVSASQIASLNRTRFDFSRRQDSAIVVMSAKKDYRGFEVFQNAEFDTGGIVRTDCKICIEKAEKANKPYKTCYCNRRKRGKSKSKLLNSIKDKTKREKVKNLIKRETIKSKVKIIKKDFVPIVREVIKRAKKVNQLNCVKTSKADVNLMQFDEQSKKLVPVLPVTKAEKRELERKQKRKVKTNAKKRRFARRAISQLMQ